MPLPTAGNAAETPQSLEPRVVTASSAYALEYSPSNAVDGDRSTYWSSSFEDNAWLAVDLGAPRLFSRIRIVWEAAYAREFSVRTSADGQSWNEVYKTASGMGGTTDILLAAPTEAHHIRVVCTRRGTPWGNAIRELSIQNGCPEGKLYFSFFSMACYSDKFWGHGTPVTGIKRIAGVAHANGIPVTWLVDSRAAGDANELFTRYHEEFGDEVALFLPGYDTETKPHGEKTWFRSLTYPRMKMLLENESAAIKLSLPWAKLEILGCSHRTDIMVRAAEEMGFKALWGHCWEQTYTDDISDRGTPWGCYYISRDCYKAPAKSPGGLVAVEWTARDLNKAFHTGNPIAFSTDPNEVIRSKPQLCDHRQIDYWKRLFDEYMANAEWNAIVPLMVQQESHESENTDGFRIYDQQTIDNSVDILDEFFKYIKTTEAVIAPASRTLAAYCKAHPSTPPTYAFVRDVTQTPAERRDKDLFIYYDANGQLFFDKGKSDPVLIRNYLGTPDPYGHDFAGVKDVPAARITETRNASEFTLDCTVISAGPLPYGFALWGDYTGRAISVSVPAITKVLDGELAYVGVVLAPGENHIRITIPPETRRQTDQTRKPQNQ